MAVDIAIIAVLVTALIAVLGGFGAVIKIAYDMARDLTTAMNGDGNGNPGFIERSQRKHDELSEEQRRINENLLIQGRLLTELTYGVCELADAIHESDQIDAEVDTERIERMRRIRREQGERYRGGNDD